MENAVDNSISDLVALLVERLRNIHHIPGNPLMGALEAWVADTALNTYRYVVRHENSGYDYSTSAESTREGYDLSKYQTVNEFLEEPNGDTVATYVSGSGLRAARLDESLDDEVRNVHHKWIISQPEVMALDPDARDVLCWEMSDAIVYESLEHELTEPLKAQPFIDVVNRHRAEAERREAERETRRQIAAERARRSAELAERTYARFRLLNAQGPTKFESPQRKRLEQLLQRLEASLGDEGRAMVAAFVRSSPFERITSNSVRERLKAKYPEIRADTPPAIDEALAEPHSGPTAR